MKQRIEHISGVMKRGVRLFGAAFLLAAQTWPQAAAAQDWPTRLITIIVPSAPGDGSDITARVFSEHLRQRLGQPVVIENRSGAGGVVGSSAAARAAPDGYTFVMGNAGSHGINAAVYKSLPYDIERDFAPIALIFQSANIFVADPASGIRSIGDLVSRMREKPGALNYASGGQGTSAHMNAEYLKLLAGGLQANHVPYRGATPALTDVVGGQVQFMAVNLPPAIGLVREGKVAPLAVTSATRNPALPEVPTVAESGFPATSRSPGSVCSRPLERRSRSSTGSGGKSPRSARSPKCGSALRALAARPPACPPTASAPSSRPISPAGERLPKRRRSRSTDARSG